MKDCAKKAKELVAILKISSDESRQNWARDTLDILGKYEASEALLTHSWQAFDGIRSDS